MNLHLDLSTARPRQAVEHALRDAIRDGRLPAGTRLPASRGLALDLGLARNTVAEAYAQLVAEGWLHARQGSGTRVSNRAAPPSRAGSIRAESKPRRSRFDLTPGQPDVTAFPRDAWAAATRRVLVEVDADAFGYGDPLGSTALRTALATYLARVRGVRTDQDHVIICAGFAQAVELLGAFLVARGARRIAVESFCIAKHRDTLARAGLEVVGVSVDRDGLDVAALETLDPDAVLVTPAHQFPLGMVLAPQRRDELTDWARRRARWVIEDDYDGEFRFDRRPVGAVQALAPDRVIYAGTASKTLAPGLRLGWLAVPPDIRPELSELRQAFPARNGILDQLALARLIESGQYDRHIRRSRLEYRRRRDQLVTLLAQRHPDLTVTGIAAGLHAVVSLPEGMSEAEAVARGADHGVEVQGLGEYATGVEVRDPALVVGYGSPAPHSFTGALARLSATLRR